MCGGEEMFLLLTDQKTVILSFLPFLIPPLVLYHLPALTSLDRFLHFKVFFFSLMSNNHECDLFMKSFYSFYLT